jgi:hypothetical protein
MMSQESQALLKTLDVSINRDASVVMQAITNHEQDDHSVLPGLSKEDRRILRTIQLTAEQIAVLQKAFVEMGRQVIFDFLCMIDGVAYTPDDVPDLALVNRLTRADITDQFLHDEFYEVLP